MADHSFVDITGQGPSRRDAQEALVVVRRYMLDVRFMREHPALAVQLPNLSRICRAYASIAPREENNNG